MTICWRVSTAHTGGMPAIKRGRDENSRIACFIAPILYKRTAEDYSLDQGGIASTPLGRFFVPQG